MKQNKFVCILALVSLLCITGFESPPKIIVSKMEIKVLEIASALRYDFILKNEGGLFPDQKDLSHHQTLGNDLSHGFLVIPNGKLASLMELVPNAKFTIMRPHGGGSSGSLKNEGEIKIHLEYAIKKGADLKAVKEYASDSHLYIFDGSQEIAKISLNKVMNKS
ncbi:hypothetical protein ACFOLF_20630 [Paenibacillus sepulcri]|uniref:Uncharacterized protein n=1 Tax=Paenibacillus sepulcri TaxID=359917 RepID=A0ABS7BYV5_9BACL|nr:hypothetical protein [Paenibacillus sepulcri]